MEQGNARLGNWLPKDNKQIADWVNQLLQEIGPKVQCMATAVGEEKTEVLKHKEVKKFKRLLDTDPAIHLLAERMVDQALDYREWDPTGCPEIKTYDEMLLLIDHIMQTAPEYMQSGKMGRDLIGFPINAVLNWCMGTPAGQEFFMQKKVNHALEKILKAWCRYLSSKESRYVLNERENGWLCQAALEELNMEQFECDKKAPYYGFKSWNDFFTRKFKEGQRPVEEKDDPYVIVSACESTPYRISTDIKEDTKFWLKGQPYALKHMLDEAENRHTSDGSTVYQTFVGGTVYQAFLSATNYHRWHSPVSGTVRSCYLVPGTYYSEVNSYPYDEAGPNNSQSYITHVAARAVILIDSDNKDIGLMAFIAVGMAEVSSCVLSVEEEKHVNKGDELGYFQFGGSTHCLIFQKDVIDTFALNAVSAKTEYSDDSQVVKVCSKLAVAKKKK